MLLGQRKEIVETILLQKCVSAGEQETIKGCFLCEANARRDFVDPDTNRPDNPGSSQFIKSTIRSIHGFPKSSLIGLRGAMGPYIDIMDERNIYSIHAEALVALLERAHGSIVTVVVDGLEIEFPDELTVVNSFAALGAEPTTDLRRDNKTSARLAPEHMTKPMFRQAVSVQRRSVEKTDAAPIGSVHGR